MLVETETPLAGKLLLPFVQLACPSSLCETEACFLRKELVYFLRFACRPGVSACHLSVSHSRLQFAQPQHCSQVASGGSHLGFRCLGRLWPLTGKTKQTVAKCPLVYLLSHPCHTMAMLGAPFCKFPVLPTKNKKYYHWILKIMVVA